MKKILTVLCLLVFCSSVFAVEFYPYKNNVGVPVNGTIRTEGCNDYITLPSKSNLTRNFTRMGVAGAVLPLLLVADPYIIPVDGVNYIMVVDRNDNNWSKNDLLGINDPKENRFASLIKLNSDGDYSKITSEELKKANIRLVRTDKNGNLLVNDRKKDLDLNKIAYIDIINLKRTANSEQTGIFGHFNVYIKTKNNQTKMVIGYVTFDTYDNLEILFK